MNPTDLSYLEFISFFQKRNENFVFDKNVVWHKHHIIPKHAGGTDDESNLVRLSLSEHSIAHYLRYLEFGKSPDLTSSKMLSGQSKSISSYGGKRGSEVCRKNKVNAFFDPSLRKSIATKGGQVQGKNNIISGHLKRISLLPRKRTKKVWLTNGTENLLLNINEKIPNGYIKGKIQKRKK